jgi:hypothetical protein
MQWVENIQDHNNVIIQTLNNLKDLGQLAICADLLEEAGVPGASELIRLYLGIFNEEDYCKYVLTNIGNYRNHHPAKDLFNQTIKWIEGQGYKTYQTGTSGGFTVGDDNQWNGFHPHYKINVTAKPHTQEQFPKHMAYSASGKITGTFGNPDVTSTVTLYQHESSSPPIYNRQEKSYQKTHEKMPNEFLSLIMGTAMAWLLSEYSLYCAAQRRSSS